ncbi:MAG: sterol-binding protein [Paucimonas sp.]|nr:sterol-binding protein [Paucimonas sp.]
MPILSEEMNPLSSVPVAAINYLLAQEPWACERLRRHAGKISVIEFGVGVMRLQVGADGMVESADANAPPSVTIRIRPADIPLLLQDRERAFSYVSIEGDAEFANAISQLSQSLRWEVEEDLSKWVGDIAARRIVAAARQIQETALSTQRKLAENAAEYLLEENPMLVRPQTVADFGNDVSRLRDDVERLAKRIEKLNRS